MSAVKIIENYLKEEITEAERDYLMDLLAIEKEYERMEREVQASKEDRTFINRDAEFREVFPELNRKKIELKNKYQSALKGISHKKNN